MQRPILLPYLARAGMALTSGPAFARTHRLVDDALLDSARADGERLTHGGDYAETRYSSLSKITADNVDRLGLISSNSGTLTTAGNLVFHGSR